MRAGPAVRGAERGRLLATFNGGFKLSAGAGGYEQEGHLAVALRRDRRSDGRGIAELEDCRSFFRDCSQAEKRIDHIVDAADREVLIRLGIALVRHDVAKLTTGRLQHILELR